MGFNHIKAGILHSNVPSKASKQYYCSILSFILSFKYNDNKLVVGFQILLNIQTFE